MTIRRQYSLPSCTLILDGLGNAADGNSSRPMMSSLVNAECHLAGQERPISGGREFFQQLIAAVSNYTQGMLSKIAQTPPSQQVGQVSIAQGASESQHRLVAPGEGGSVEWNLTTVQLFDLVEAIDQFLADGSTLPDLQVALRPAPKTTSNQLARQAAPIGLGLSGLAATALAFMVMPTPTKVLPNIAPTPVTSTQPATGKKEAKPPTSTKPSPAQPSASSTPSTSPSATPSVSPSASSKPSTSPVSSNPAINNNTTQVAFIKRKLRREINQEWKDRTGITNKLEYKVFTNAAGEIVKYEPKSELAKTKQELTPFPKLVSSPAPQAEKNLAEYTVGFTPNGALEINKYRTLKAAETLGAVIKDDEKVKSLVAQVNTKVQLQDKPTFKENLTYRVAANESGEIVDYEPINQAAFDYEQETPLPKTAKYDEKSAAGEKPLAQYTVTYQPNGMVKVDPRK
jgi:Domain of unknown function (DUF4335)